MPGRLGCAHRLRSRHFQRSDPAGELHRLHGWRVPGRGWQERLQDVHRCHTARSNNRRRPCLLRICSICCWLPAHALDCTPPCWQPATSAQLAPPRRCLAWLAPTRIQQASKPPASAPIARRDPHAPPARRRMRYVLRARSRQLSRRRRAPTVLPAPSKTRPVRLSATRALRARSAWQLLPLRCRA